MTTHHEVRFRGRTSDGQEVTSQPARVRASRPAAQGALVSAHFAHTTYREGESAVLVAEVQDHPHDLVRFIVEKKDGSSWTELATVRGHVENGRAQGSWHVSDCGGAEVRFRAVAAFGRLASDSITVQAGGALSDPSWSHDGTVEHADYAVMRVNAAGADGARVRFTVEQQRGDQWVRYATAEATVQGGAAQATVRVHHPLFSDRSATTEHLTGAPPANFRFNAQLI